MTRIVALLLGLLAAGPALAQPAPPADGFVQIDFDEVPLLDLVLWAADAYEVPFILGDVEPLKARTVTILSHRPVPADDGWHMFVQAMQESGFAVIFVSGTARVVPVSEVATQPLVIRTGVPR